MAYTPELNDASAATLRRLAWAVGKPMTQTMNAIFMKLPSMCDKQKICECCKDPSICYRCGFGTEPNEEIA
jgi:hypothetical protein